MGKDFTEYLDDYCQDLYGHTNWTYLDSMTSDMKKRYKKGLGTKVDIYFFFEEKLCEDQEHFISECTCDDPEEQECESESDSDYEYESESESESYYKSESESESESGSE